jgi:hypothetical protein
MPDPKRLSRLLSREEAASYCHIAAETFDAHVRPYVQPIKIGAKILWDIKALDHWLDVQSGLTQGEMRSSDQWLSEVGNDRESKRR